MVVSCQILINKPKGGHRPGQSVTGIVKYALDKPLEVKNVVLSFIGKGRCNWSESTTSNDERKSVSYDGREDYFATCVNIIKKNSKDEIITITEGTYEYPFEFKLPENIPSSFKSLSANIGYFLMLTFDRPGIFKFNKRHIAEIQVRNTIENDEVPVVFGLEKTLTKPFSNKKHVVNLKAEIARSSFISGEKVPLTLVLTNDTGVNIKAIKTELIRYKTLKADCGHKTYETSIVRECTVQSTSIPKQSIVNLTQEIPTLLDMYSVRNSKIISVEFKLKVIVRLPFPHINPTVEIPIVIGDKIEEDLEEDPPSYWEAMTEEEKVKD